VLIFLIEHHAIKASWGIGALFHALLTLVLDKHE